MIEFLKINKLLLVSLLSLLIGLISLTGLIRKKLNLFLSGFFIIGILIVEAEFRRYADSHTTHHLFFGSIFLIQAVLSLPFLNGGGWTKDWGLTKRLMALLIINVTAIIAIKNYDYNLILSSSEIKYIALEHAYYALLVMVAIVISAPFKAKT